MSLSRHRDASVGQDHRDRRPSTPFRSFAAEDFCITASWLRLARILTGNGGCYGLYGPRGAGKSWLMLKAIEQANENGVGLWFPCPSEYDAMPFLSMLSDNLASVVERRFVRDNLWTQLTRRLQLLLSLVISVPICIAVLTYIVRGLSSKAAASRTAVSTLPGWLWLVVGIAIGLVVVLVAAQLIWERRPAGQLGRAATALRERIRFSASMKLGNEVTVSGGSRITGTLKRSHEHALDERPTTVASLVFDFRNLAELITKTLRHPVVIGIDELDKIDDLQVVLKLLRDIKGIFEIADVTFLVSVSEEAATALQLGPLRTRGRNEFNSSFYTVIELPPLSPAETEELLRLRRIEVTPLRAHVLCLLGAGNFREIVRLAERAHLPGADPDWGVLISTLQEESAGLIREIISESPDDQAEALRLDTVTGVWEALPHAAFLDVAAFVALSSSAIDKFWKPSWADDHWTANVQESWRRLLVRLFIAGSVIAHQARFENSASQGLVEMIADLRDVVIMATHSAEVARFMLEARFGSDLSSPYPNASEHRQDPLPRVLALRWHAASNSCGQGLTMTQTTTYHHGNGVRRQLHAEAGS
jgi:hypothetical protein